MRYTGELEEQRESQGLMPLQESRQSLQWDCRTLLGEVACLHFLYYIKDCLKGARVKLVN